MEQAHDIRESSADLTADRFLPEEWVIRRDLLAQVYRNSRIILLGHGVICAVDLSVLWGLVPHKTWELVVWPILVATLILLRARHNRHVHKVLPSLDAQGVAHYESLLARYVGLFGLMWGVLPVLFYEGGQGNHFVDAHIVSQMAALCSIVIVGMSAQLKAVRAFLLASLLPYAVLALFYGWQGRGWINWAGGVTMFFTLFFFMRIARGAHEIVRNNLIVTYQNRGLAQALQAEHQTLRSFITAKNLFHAGVTHDLRQPLHAVALHLGYLRKLRTRGLDPQTFEQCCDVMESSLQTMSSQLSHLLNLSRMESGEIKPEWREVDLSGVLDACTKKFALLAREKGLQFRLRASSVIVRSDRQMLQSVLDNFVSNAIRYTDAGGVLLVARRRGANLQVGVYDTGRGLSEEQMPQLFVAYRRFDDRRSSDGDAFGLGLALVAKQAELLGYRVIARSRVGRGSYFGIEVPFVEKNSSQAFAPNLKTADLQKSPR